MSKLPKFRAIHKHGGTMKDHREVCRLLYNEACGTMSTINAYHIMQFTGLKDKIGVEVYGGDIVECYLNHHGKPSGVGFNAHIRYNEDFGVWQIAYKNIGNKEVWDNIGHRYFLEIKGNIHQHKHLLK